MAVPTPCPDVSALRKLLDETLPPDEQARLADHLQSCAKCQARLETLAAGKESWDEAAGLLSGQPPNSVTEPALQRALANLEHGGGNTEADETDDLAFLHPPTRDGSLGRLDQYEILSVVGRGGMGIVLKAFDDVLQRVVAVKVMAPALAATPQARKRFIREAQAAAAVVHDHVVTIHAVQPQGHPYLVMHFVGGISLEEKIQRKGALELKEILRIGMQTAAGLAAAHEQGLVHRDIKPANILLENGVERVRITDFGLARQIEEAGLTQSGTVAGTPAYMAPEQARGDDVDFRADLFSLGSVLYAMCTGKAPFQGSTNLAVLRRVSDEQPTPVRKRNPEIPEELAVVINKLHSKDPAARYSSAAEVAEVLGEMLAQVQRLERGRPADGQHRHTRPTRRKLLLAGLTAAILVTFGVYHFSSAGLEPNRGNDTNQEDASRRPPVICGGHIGAVYGLAFSPDGESVTTASADKTVRIWNARTGEVRQILRGHPQPVRAVAFSPDGETVASACDGAEVRLWNAADGKQLDVLEGHSARLFAIAFSPDGHTLASAGCDFTIRLWDLKTRTAQVLTEDQRVGFIRRLAFSPDGTILVSAGNQITYWNIKTRTPIRSVGLANTSGLAWAPDGRFLAAASWRTGALALFDPANGKQLAAWQVESAIVESVAVSPKDSLLATVGGDGLVQVWDSTNQRLHRRWAAHVGRISDVVFSRDGAKLATAGSDDAQVKIWDFAHEGSAPSATEQTEPLAFCPQRMVLDGHMDGIHDLAFASGGNVLATGSHDKTVRLWDARSGKAGHVLRGHQCDISGVRFAPDGQTLASCGGDQEHSEILLWDVKTGAKAGSIDGHKQMVYDIAFSPDGKSLASAGHEKIVRVHDLATRQQTLNVDDKQGILTRRVAFTGDGSSLLCCGTLLNFYDARTGELTRSIPHDETTDMKLSPRGDVLAAAAWQSAKISLYDFTNGKLLATWRAHDDALHSLAFSPDGRFLASTSADGSAKIWEVSSQKLRAVLLGHRNHAYGIAFSPDGQTLATGASAGDSRAILWDVSALYGKAR